MTDRINIMNFSPELIAELELLSRFPLETTQMGIKVHSNAKDEQIAAVQRLYHKGLVTQIDGGYLTDLGRTTNEHIAALALILDQVDA